MFYRSFALLKKQTLIQVTAAFQGCNNFSISSYVTFTTGYGKPDQAQNPKVQQSADACFVVVEQNPTIEQYIVSFVCIAFYLKRRCAKY